MAKLIVKDVQQKTTKSGKPYLAVKSSTDKFYTIWQEQQYIWHLFVPEAELDVVVSTNGKFTSITGVAGITEPNASGGTTLYKTPAPNFNDWLTEKIKSMDAKLDYLVNEKKTLEALPPLDAKDEIKVENLPF